MKKCYNIKTWEEQKDAMISLSEKYITISKIYNKGCSGEFFNNEYIDKSTPTDTILAKLCELTGAKMYGDYIIINNRYYMTHSESGDLFYGDIVSVGFGGYPIPGYYYDLRVIGGGYPLQDCRHFIEKKAGNIFEEYSKFLRQEENKWEESKKLLNL
jgi:hypothetical protein